MNENKFRIQVSTVNQSINQSINQWVVDIISRIPLFKESHARFTTVLLKLYLINKVEDIVVFLTLKCLILTIFR